MYCAVICVMCFVLLTGEMGGTVLSHPAQYLKVYDMIKKGWKNDGTLKVTCCENVVITAA